MIVRVGLTSPFPRPEPLVQATRDLDRGRTSADAVEAVYARTEEEVAELETRLGLDVRTAGYLRWPDLFRPIAERWSGFAVGPLTRWLETNTFYRQPILLAPPARVAGAVAAQLPGPIRRRPAGSRILLPGPYTFARLLDNRSGEADAAVVHRLGRLLADEVRELVGLGFDQFQFSDPLLAVEPAEGPHAEATVAAYAALGAAADPGTAIAWTHGADGRRALPVLRRIRPVIAGFDLSETDPGELPDGDVGPAVAFGVLDPRTTLAEEPRDVAGVVRTAAARLGASTVWLGPGAPLDLLPWEPAVRKVELLGRIRGALANGGGA